MDSENKFDVVIIGAGIAGCSLAHALSSSSLRIVLLERSLSEPDRIVGELLQPAGVLALRKLGLEHCLEGIDAIPVKGYCVVETSQGRQVHIPYLPGCEGRSFHHGRLIMKLRDAARRAPGVHVIEAAANELVKKGRKVVGVKATTGDQARVFFADLVIVADGCFSNFRSSVVPSLSSLTKSHFVGVVLEDAILPYPQHGTVALVENSGPVLLYQIGKRDTRMLVDVRVPLPADLKTYILTAIVPQLPSSLHHSIHIALEKDRLRRMPNSFLPPVDQSIASAFENVILVGDAYNMRHPLTGGGMTVAFNDVVLLRDLLRPLSRSQARFGDQKGVKGVLTTWFTTRKNLATSINILSVALYDLFGANGSELSILREGCFKYFELGGSCITGPVGLLSGITPSPLLLFRHFFMVAFYSIWIMFTHPQIQDGQKERPSVLMYPALTIKAFKVFYTACIVFTPLLWTEMRPSRRSWLWLFAFACVVAGGVVMRIDEGYRGEVLEGLFRKIQGYNGYNVSLWD